jgi:putative phosphoesterase
MRIAVISDIHDNLWNLASALDTIKRTADVLLCCGDLCSPFVIDELAKFEGAVHVVFGNNDADLYRITAKAAKTSNVHLYGELFAQTFEGKRFAMNHFDYLARPIAKSGDYDVVCFGHNHEFEVTRQGQCLLINPGPVMGAKFSHGRWEDVAASFVIYDTATDRANAFSIDAKTKQVYETP